MMARTRSVRKTARLIVTIEFLLKAQVQPHFLFNTLNNMYYEAYMEAPRTALLIERLSDIMRYFIDQNIQDMVPIETEVQFLDNYIALEKIRI